MENIQNNINLDDKKIYSKHLIRFIVFSAIGIAIFFWQVPQENGTANILFGVITNWLKNSLGAANNYIIFSIIVGNSIFFLIGRFIKKKGNVLHDFYSDVSLYQIVCYAFGSIVIIMYILNIGPQWLIGEDTSGAIVGILKTIIWTISLGAAFVSLLTSYGALDFIGTLFEPLMRPLYKLPGCSALDAIASFVGTSSIGVYMTSLVYKKGKYTQREAISIATTFSVVSVSFAAVCVETAGMMPYFGVIFISTFMITFGIAFIMVRIPPLSRKQDIYFDGTEQPESERKERVHYSGKLFKTATDRAVTQASTIPNAMTDFGLNLWSGAKLLFKALAVVFSVGTVGMILAECTPLFEWLGYPVVPLLKVLGIPNAEIVASTVFVGFAEMFLPNILIAGVEMEVAAKFFVCVLSMVQIIYMSEVGVVLLICGIPIKMSDMIIIFLERTIIAIPIIAGFMHLLCYAGVF